MKESERFDYLPAKLISIRTTIGWSQAIFAYRAGIERATLSKIEKGTHLPSLRTINKMALALKVPMSKLIDQSTEFFTDDVEIFYRRWFNITLLNKEDQKVIDKFVDMLIKGD